MILMLGLLEGFLDTEEELLEERKALIDEARWFLEKLKDEVYEDEKEKRKFEDELRFILGELDIKYEN